MCQALLEIMEPHLLLRDKKIREEVSKEVREQDIQMAVDILKRLGHGDSEIEREIIKTYALTEEAAAAYL